MEATLRLIDNFLVVVVDVMRKVVKVAFYIPQFGIPIAELQTEVYLRVDFW